MQNKYLAMTPPMGWNSWNTFTWNINEDLVCGAADALCASGLKDKGYEYVVIDDCWSLKQRDENGRLVPDPEKFPHGMKAVADYVHSKGLNSACTPAAARTPARAIRAALSMSS